jgi:glucose/mannose-6-phosphate isomerase
MTTTARLDTAGLWDATLGLPEQIAGAVLSPGEQQLPEHDSLQHVVLLGAGATALAGELVVATAGPLLPVPLVAVQGYTLPSFVDRGTLVLALSHTGEDDDVNEAAQEAALAGATVVGISAGGTLAELCQGWGSPHVAVTRGIPAARCALGALAVPALCVLEDVGMFPGARTWVQAAVDQLQRRRDALSRSGNAMEAMARRIGRTFVLAHGGGDLGAVAAHRFKSQVNANAKVPAFWAVHPDLDHDELAGWGQHGDVTRQLITVVTFRHDSEHPQVDRRFALVAEQIDETVAGVEAVLAEGEGDIAQLFDLIFQGDLCSLHLAAEEGLDPGPVPAIATVQAALGG